jgi:hypothetical protein
METPQHLFALTKPEQRVVLLIILGLLFAAAFGHYHGKEGNWPPSAHPQAAPHPKPSTDENSEEE